MRFDLVDLRLFVHVCEAGSITAGAERAGLALASASERVRAMELDAATALLERGRRGVRPTPAGRALVHHARMILDQSERMRGDLAQYGDGLKGHVRMMASSAAIAEHLPGPLAAFLTANPQVDVDLEEGTSRDIYLAVAAGRIDLGIGSDQVDAGELELVPFARDALVAIAPQDHPLAGAKSVSFAETLAFDHVGLRSGAGLSDYLSAQARRLGRRLACRVRVASFETVCRMVEQGVGVGISPNIAATRASRSMTIRIVPLTDAWAQRDLVIATHPTRELPPHARSLVDFLTASAEL